MMDLVVFVYSAKSIFGILIVYIICRTFNVKDTSYRSILLR